MTGAVNIDKERGNIDALFDRIAPRYDVLNHLLTLGIDRRWRRKAARSVPREAANVLDVAAGTADLSIAMAQREQRRRVTGVDLSAGMLALGENKVEEHGLQERITLLQANVATLPFGDGTFDAVTCAFGVRNFSRRQQGLREMQRVLRRHGRIVILEFSYPRNAVVRFFYDWYFTKVLPWIGRRVSKDGLAYNYLPASVKSFPYGQPFADELCAAGFTKTRMQPLSCGICTLYVAEKP